MNAVGFQKRSLYHIWKLVDRKLFLEFLESPRSRKTSRSVSLLSKYSDWFGCMEAKPGAHQRLESN